MLAQLVVNGGTHWFSLVVKRASILVTFLGALQVITGKARGADAVMALLLFQHVLGIGDTLSGKVHKISNMEKDFLKVQRVLRLLDIPHENKDQPMLKNEWPTEGKILLNDVKLRYRPTTDMVLKGLNISIKGGEKVGIVGRTGAGKSTLAMALTRIVEICGGAICIDGVDISKTNMQ